MELWMKWMEEKELPVYAKSYNFFLSVLFGVEKKSKIITNVIMEWEFCADPDRERRIGKKSV